MTPSEIEAERELRIMFPSLWPHVRANDCYDFLTKIAERRIYIEVKKVRVRHRSGQVVMTLNQLVRLVRTGGKDVLFYFVTKQGNFAAPITDILAASHIHHNELNPKEKRIVFNIRRLKDKWEMYAPFNCFFCDGPFLVG